jgi:hypothetical protein
MDHHLVLDPVRKVLAASACSDRQAALVNLEDIAQEEDEQTFELEVHRLARSYAGCGVPEVLYEMSRGSRE